MNSMMTAWQMCRDMGLTEHEFMELIGHIDTPALECLPENKLWLIPLCILQNDRLCKMRFMYQNLDEFISLVHNGSLNEISEVFAGSATAVDPWMGLLIEEGQHDSMDSLLYKDWNMEKPVIALTGQTVGAVVVIAYCRGTDSIIQCELTNLAVKHHLIWSFADALHAGFPGRSDQYSLRTARSGKVISFNLSSHCELEGRVRDYLDEGAMPCFNVQNIDSRSGLGEA